jgi:hypothetical protein
MNSRQPKKARCIKCGSSMRNRTADGIALTNDSKLCARCEADKIIDQAYRNIGYM